MSMFLEILFIWSLFSISTAQQCRNEEGKRVDWFFAFKPPAQKDQQNTFLRNGIGYIYVTSMNSTANWKMSKKSIKNPLSLFGRTLSPLYNKQKLLYIMYNDDPPMDRAGTYHGHAKGVVMTDGKTGLWMVHSTPNYPAQPINVDNSTVETKYSFPASATKFGQSFLCLTLPVSEMNKIGVSLQYIGPKYYNFNLPDSIKSKVPDLAEVIESRNLRNLPVSHITTLTTLNGTTFVSYAKTRFFDKDLYTDLLAPDLKSDLFVETWSNGPNDLPSDCDSKYHVMDVKDIEINTSDNYKIQFKNSQDHSKWAVSVNSDSKTVCVGDINRMVSQFKRGGGTVCFKNSSVWSKYMKAVIDVYPCPYFRSLTPAIRTNKNHDRKSDGD